MVPVYASSTAEQAAYVVEHSDARVLFVDTEPLLRRVLGAWPRLAGVRRIVTLDDRLDVGDIAESLRNEGAPLPSFSKIERKVIPFSRALAVGKARDLEDPEAFERTMDAVSLSQPAVMLYTSGTSGLPKGVPLTHENLAVNGADWLRVNAPLLDEGAVDLLWLPMSHIFGFGEATIGDALGWVSYMADPATVLGLVPEVKPSVFMSVPSLWEKLAVSGKGNPQKLLEVTGGRMRFCLSGGAGLKREVKETFHRAGILIIEGYGLTEASPTLTLNRPGDFRFDSVGKPLPSVTVELAEDGEVLAKGKSIFGGYHKDPAATREVLTDDGWLRTGDIGRFTDDGFLQIIDRKKDILVTAGGKNVAPANIELRFRDDPFIEHVVVYGDGRKYLVAGVWPNRAAIDAHLAARGVAQGALMEAARALISRRIDFVNADLARYETIKTFALIDEPLTVENGLLTPTLKVKRKKVYERFGDRLESLYS
jgi:long-chain acyl-CoA synthetase